MIKNHFLLLTRHQRIEILNLIYDNKDVAIGRFEVYEQTSGKAS
jgi:hypothetical protein